MADEAVKAAELEQVDVDKQVTVGAEEKVAGVKTEEIKQEERASQEGTKTKNGNTAEVKDSKQDVKDEEKDAEIKEEAKPTRRPADSSAWQSMNNDRRYRKNIKSSYEDLPISDDPDEIRKQVEFYFSDGNLLSDRYLFEMVRGCENRSVPIKVIHDFKRMRHFQPYSAVVDALRDSETLEVIDARSGESASEEVKRKVSLDEEHGTEFDPGKLSVIEDRFMPMTIYAKGFGEEEKGTQREIEDFFAPYGATVVRLRRRFPDRTFKGSVFVTFENAEAQQQFLELDPKPKWKNQDLKIMSKKEYCDEKAELIKQGKIQPNSNGPYQYRGRGRGGFRGRDRGRGGRGGRDDRRDRDDWRGRRDDFQKNGFRDRNDRRNGRAKRRRDRSESEESEEDRKPKAVQEYDEKGIPIVKATTHDNESNEHLNGGKKRSREDEQEKEGSPKRAKAENVREEKQATTGAAAE